MTAQHERDAGRHGPAARPERDGPERRGGGVPDGLLVGGVMLLAGLATFVWTATGLAGLVAHGRWPDQVTFLRTGTAVRALLTAPRDVAGAWPATPPEQLPSGTVLWLVFLTQLVVVFSTVLLVAFRVAQWRARREERRAAAAEDRERRARPVSPEAAPGATGARALEYGEEAAPDPYHRHREPAPPPRPSEGPHPAPPATPAPTAVPTPTPTPTPTAAASPGPGAGRDPVAAVLHGPEGLVVLDPDGRLWSKTARQRGKRGPVHVYDPGHASDAPVRLRWAPQRGCEDMAVARRRAGALLAPVRPSEPVFELDFETAKTLLRCYLHAAALAGDPLQQVLRWAHGGPAGSAGGAPAKVLRGHRRAAPGSSMELESTLASHPGRRDAALELIARALAGLEQLHIRQSCSPGRVDTLALDNIAGEGGTLYVVGDHRETAGLRHALAEAVTADQPGLTVVDGGRSATTGPGHRRR